MSWNFLTINGFVKLSRFVIGLCWLLAIIMLSSNASYATHAAGADLTYRCLGGLVYEVDATFYRDCGGTPEPGNLTITYKSANCTYSRTVIANKVAVGNGVEITTPCNTSPSSCNGGFSTGLRKWVYRAVVTLPFACSDWVFSYRVCCRNCTVTTIQTPCASNSELYVEARLNNIVASCNNSPQFSAAPIAFICLGQNFNYNQGVYDIDGDSLSYELITPKTTAITEVTWVAPASQQSPLASSTPFTINSITGDINFTPASIQIGILAVRVNEFRGGILIGSTIRDMQIYTQNCFNTIPSASGIDGTINFTDTVCAGQPQCFTIYTTDVDSTQSVTFTYSNIPQGAVVTEVQGVRPSLNFCWTPSHSDVSRLPKIFTLSVRDNACPYNGVQTFSYSLFVGGPGDIIVSSTDPTCIGASNGTATVSGSWLSGGTIEWNTVPVQYTPNIAGLDTGIYYVTVSDYSGCAVSEQVIINPSTLSLLAEAIGSGIITCTSGNIGQAQTSILTGQAPFTYLWSNGMNTSTISGLGSGIYSVTILDANGCSVTDTASIQEITWNVQASASTVSDVSCFGGNNGSGQVNITGGTAPFSFLWSNNATTSSILNLQAGTYYVTVTDADGCFSIDSITVQQPPQPLSFSQSSINDVNCYGGSDGSIFLTLDGGVSPYNYSWSTGDTTASIQNLTAGMYAATITDANGCSVSLTETIQQPAEELYVALDSIVVVSCFGGNDGLLQIEASGGTGPYTYLWSSGSTNSYAGNLTAGNYTCTVTDVNGCITELAQLIEEPELPVTLVVTEVNHIECNQPVGSIELTGFGGVLPLEFLWNTGSTTEDLNNLQPGWYTVTATDVNGCTAQSSVEIVNNSSTLIVEAIHLQNVLCFNMSNGVIEVNVANGVEPYIFQWNNGAVSNQIQNLSAGNYSLTVTDASGCSIVSTYTISQPSAPLIPILTPQQQLPCSGILSGGMNLQINGGVAPYNFVWSNGALTQNLSEIGPGTYTVTVTDANGCNAIISAELFEVQAGLMGSIVLVNPVSCNGGSNGAAVCNIAGGTSPYSYQWSDGSTASDLTGVVAGIYTVTVTDVSGCSYSESITINQPLSALIITGTTTNADCLNNIGGSINTVVNGGSAPYSLIWSNSQITASAINVMPGSYTLTITDANGCVSEKIFTVSDNSQLNVTANGPLTVCAGDMVTLIADSTSQGVYQWYFEGNLLNGATGSTFTTPAAGSYTVSLTNSCGTFWSDTLEVEVKSIDNVSVSNTQIICPPETATLVATGGTSYNWSPASYITFTNIPDPIVSPQITTLYTVEITNQYGCKTSLNTNVAVVCDSLLVPTGFSPNDDGVNDGYVVDGIENYHGNKLWVYNRWGKLVYKATDYMNSWNGVSNISGIYMNKKVPSGTYYFILDLNDRSKPRAGYLIIRH